MATPARSLNRRLSQSRQQAIRLSKAVSIPLPATPPRGSSYQPLSAANLQPLFISRDGHGGLLLDDVQSISLLKTETFVGARITRLLHTNSALFPWQHERFHLWLLRRGESTPEWTRAIALQKASYLRSRVVCDLTDPMVRETIWLRGEEISYIEGEPWQRFLLRRFPLYP